MMDLDGNDVTGLTDPGLKAHNAVLSVFFNLTNSASDTVRREVLTGVVSAAAHLVWRCRKPDLTPEDIASKLVFNLSDIMRQFEQMDALARRN